MNRNARLLECGLSSDALSVNISLKVPSFGASTPARVCGSGAGLVFGVRADLGRNADSPSFSLPDLGRWPLSLISESAEYE